MLQKKISTKQELLKAIQSANIKAIEATDVFNKDDITSMQRVAEQQMKAGKRVTVIVITS